MLAQLLVSFLVVVVCAAEEVLDIVRPFRPIPAVEPELLQSTLSPKIELFNCNTYDCKTPLKNTLEEVTEQVVTVVIGDLEDLFSNNMLAERIAIGCAKMNYISVLVYWHQFQPNYYQSVSNSHGVAKQISEYVIKKLRRIHLIGLGIGAHVAGFVGKYSKVSAGKLYRITALDPTRILYEYNEGPPELRLDRDDAIYVEVFHSDYKGKMRVGFIQSLGTVDFYERGGSMCNDVGGMPEDSLQFWRKPYEELRKVLSRCKHNLAIVNFIQSMSVNCTLYARRDVSEPCQNDNCIPVGFMSMAFVVSNETGAGDGNYVYNCSKCLWGIPRTAKGGFMNVYNAFQAAENPLLDERGWLEWVADSVYHGVYLVMEPISGVWDWIVGWAGYPGLKGWLSMGEYETLPGTSMLPSLPRLPTLDFLPSLNPFHYTYLLNPMTYVPSVLNPFNYIPEIPYVPIIGR